MLRSGAGSNKGATLIEVAVVLIIMLILGSGFGLGLSSIMEESRKSAVLAQLDRAKTGVISYVSDMGGLPPGPGLLTLLPNAGSQPDYSVDPSVQMGAGWRGPYLPDNGLSDPWGRGLLMTVGAATSATTGAPTVAILRSLGPDGINGNTDDSVAEIYKREVHSQVIGYVKDRTFATLPGIGVKLSIASSGTIATLAGVTDAGGRYQFTDVPQGRRILQAAPKLSYRPGTAFATGASKNEVEFVVENLGKDPTAFTSFTVNYLSVPQGYFRRVTIDNNEVRNSNSPRRSSGVLTSFNAPFAAGFTLTGTGVTQEAIQVLVNSLTTQLPDTIIGGIGTGGAARIRLEDFDDVASGNGGDVDMTGVTFEVIFSDGSITLFTAVKK